MHFGWKTDESTSSAILDRFREAGGNFIQAASSIGSDGGLDRLATALSEEHVGRWMARHEVPRESVVLATRLVLRDLGPASASLAEVIRECCEASLRRLRTDHLDLFMLEWSPALGPMEAVLEALVPLVWKGRVRVIGASGFPAWRLMDARACSARRSIPGFDVAQHDHSLVMRSPFEPELQEFCRENRVGFLARSPLAGGFLVGETPGRRTWVHPGRAAWMRERYLRGGGAGTRDVLGAVAANRGASAAQTALAWVLDREDVTAAVVGVTSPAQLGELVVATQAPLTACERALLEGRPAWPGRTAPGDKETTSRPDPAAWTVGVNN